MDQTTTTRVRYVIQEHVHQENPVVGPVLEMIVDVTTIVMVILFVKMKSVLGVGMKMTAMSADIHTVMRKVITFAIFVRQTTTVMALDCPLIMALYCPFATPKMDIVIFVH